MLSNVKYIQNYFSNTENKEIICLEDITFSYDQNPILEEVNLSLKEGDFIAVIGPNGAAKSTLLKIMVGLLKPQKGKVKIFGSDIRHFKNWHHIGYVSQQASQINTAFPATVQEVVSTGYFTGFVNMFKISEKNNAVNKALEIAGIQELSRRKIGELSGGQRQKVFLAKALVKKPKILIMDEPTAGIDVASRQEFYGLLKNLNTQYNITIVVVTHDINEIMDKVKKICCVKNKKAIIFDNNDSKAKRYIADTMEYTNFLNSLK